MDAKLDDILSKLSHQAELIQIQSTKMAALDSIEHTLIALLGNFEMLNSQIATIEDNQTAQGSNVSAIRTKLEEAQTEINVLKQQNLSSNFVLYGLPPNVTSEQFKEVIKSFCSNINVPLDERDIVKSHARHNDKNEAKKSEPIIVGTLTNVATKDYMKKQFNLKKPVVVEDVINFLAETSKWRGKEIAMQNQLTEHNREFCCEAHQLNQGRYKYVWESNGRIMLRKFGGQRPVIIKTKTQFIEAMSTVVVSTVN